MPGHGPGDEDRSKETEAVKIDFINFRPFLKNSLLDFPGGTVDKNPLANVGHRGLIPGLGRSHRPRSN